MSNADAAADGMALAKLRDAVARDTGLILRLEWTECDATWSIEVVDPMTDTGGATAAAKGYTSLAAACKATLQDLSRERER